MLTQLAVGGVISLLNIAIHAMFMAMVVAESYRQRGLGGQLIRAAEAILTERGVRILVVTTGNQRDRAHKFYERNGYTFTGRRYMKRLSP